MQAIDHHAWTNRWRDRHPLEKLLPAVTLLLLTLVLPPLSIGPLVLAGTTLATVCGSPNFRQAETVVPARSRSDP